MQSYFSTHIFFLEHTTTIYAVEQFRFAELGVFVLKTGWSEFCS